MQHQNPRCDLASGPPAGAYELLPTDEGRVRRPIVQEADGSVRVRGTVRLDEAGSAIGRSLEHEKVTTISGLVLLLLNRPASSGDVVTWRNVRIEVVSAAGRGVGEAVLSLINK